MMKSMVNFLESLYMREAVHYRVEIDEVCPGRVYVALGDVLHHFRSLSNPHE